MGTPDAYTFGSFRFDAAAYRLFAGDRPLHLSPKILDLLRLLASRPSQLVTKEDILRELWPDVAVTDNAITQAVSELRQALGDDPSAPRFVQTVPRRGYRFIAPVDAVATPVLSRPSPASGSAAARPAIGVADFENVTGDANDGWMAAGIADTVANDLRSCGNFRVMDRRGLPVAARGGSMEAARDFRLDLLVAGSYQRRGDRLRITARVIELATGEAVAHAKADGPLAEAFHLQDAIVHHLIRSLPRAMTSAAGRRTGVRETCSLEAYRALTEGKLKLETLDPGQMRSAAGDFDRAIALDPRYAQAYVGLAQAHLGLFDASRARNRPDSSALRAAIAYGRRAIELESELAEAHATLALLFGSAGRTAEALAAGRMAVALEPNEWRHRFRLGVAAWGSERLACFDDVVHLFPECGDAYFGSAMVYVARAELSTAEEILRQGIAVRQRAATPIDRFPATGLHWLLGLIRLCEGDVREARAEFDRELTSPGSRVSPPQHTVDAYDGHGFACLRVKDFNGAEAMFSRSLALDPEHARSLVGLSHALEGCGRRDAAQLALDQGRRAVDELNAGSRRAEAKMAIAFIHSVGHRPDDAVNALTTLLAEAPPGLAGWTIPIEPLLGKLRTTPSFRALLARLAQRAT